MWWGVWFTNGTLDGKPKTTQLHIIQMYTDENTLFFEWISINFCFVGRIKMNGNQDFKIPFKLRTKIWNNMFNEREREKDVL